MTRLNENARELAKLLTAECNGTQDVATLLKKLFAGTIEEMLKAEMDTYLGYAKHDNSGPVCQDRCQ
jgi:putative transposase